MYALKSCITQADLGGCLKNPLTTEALSKWRKIVSAALGLLSPLQIQSRSILTERRSSFSIKACFSETYSFCRLAYSRQSKIDNTLLLVAAGNGNNLLCSTKNLLIPKYQSYLDFQRLARSGLQ